jgi:hypothetical protein
MTEERFRHRLDVFYLATIGYGVTLIAYVALTGLWADDRFELVWRDPIVYLLAGCAALSLVGLIVAAVANRKLLVREHELVFRTRFAERILKAGEIEWISFRSEPRAAARIGRSWPVARLKVKGQRRRRRLRPGAFERSDELIRTLRDWARANGVELLIRRRVRPRAGGASAATDR